jgi:nitric oxide reductase NorD protein
MSLFEPEEFVGQYWHRLVGSVRTYRSHPDAAVSLEAMGKRVGILFRAFGGSGAVRIVPAAASHSGHRLNFLQSIGLGTETLERSILDSSTLRLPARIDVFPDSADNEALYEWQAAWFAHAVAPAFPDDDPLRNDIRRLRAAVQTTRATLNNWPGMRAIYARLRAATLGVRPRRAMPAVEGAVETAIIGLLNGDIRNAGPMLAAILEDRSALEEFRAPRGYRTFLPVPLWGEVMADAPGGASAETDEPGGESISVDFKRRRAVRRSTEQSDRGDPLLLHRFETIFSLAEMVNVNRPVEDDEEGSARQAAEDLPELTIGSNRKRAATRLKLDLDLSPGLPDTAPLKSEHTYPEWDWKRQCHHRDHCRVLAAPAVEQGEDWAPDLAMQQLIRQVRRQFEALRPRRQLFGRQSDGDDLDLSAVVRDAAERQARGMGIEQLFISARPAARDLSLAVLMDVSLSTDAWIGPRRVLDVEKSALLALTHGLTACGDEHAIFTFTSRRRTSVNVATVKDFEESLSNRVVRRIEALKPGQYTRIGAAVRHVTTRLAERPHRHRLLLLISDGKPNDIDHYEGRYGIEDSRMAIREARKAGLRVFGVTVDEDAKDYFPYIFGRGAYAIVSDISRLPAALPAIYRQITN